MTRYYYTDLIKALYMMKEFEVKFVGLNEKALIKLMHLAINMHEGLSLKDIPEVNLYVAPESENIFEQKKGDIGIQDDGEYFAIAKAHDIEDFEDNRHTISPSHYWTIIMRDSKLFFNPLIENNDQ